MKITNLNDLKLSIGRAISLSFVVIFAITVFIIFVTYKEFEYKRQELNQQQILSASDVYQSNLSEQLSVIASSDEFMDYLRSGKETRAQMYPDFIYQILSLKVKSVMGMKISTLDGQELFNYGKTSPDQINLKVCYLNQELNPQLGECSYQWTLYLSRTTLAKDLQSINPAIQECKQCRSVPIFANPYFQNFIVQDISSIAIPIAVKTAGANVIYLYILLIFVMLIILATWNKYKIKATLNRFVADPLEKIGAHLKAGDNLLEDDDAIQEIHYLTTQINDWKNQVNEAEQQKHEAEIGRLASQVAHDIRSPVAALNAVSQDLAQLPENRRIMIRNAAQRINDIANNLLHYYRQKTTHGFNNKIPEDIMQAELISYFVETIISEKREQFSGLNIEFSVQIASDSYGVFAKVNPIEFKRVLSNLMNNAVEAIEQNGKVEIAITKNSGFIIVAIKDNGRGIPHELLPRVVEGGVTYGKKEGSGLGLSSAVKQIEAWGGQFSIHSVVNQGTSVEIILPQAFQPEWFATQLFVPNHTTIVILDDDDNIHQIWKRKFEKSIKHNEKVNIIDFYKPEELLEWHKTNSPIKAIYLMDYELIGSPLNGLDVVKQLDIASSSILVTSRYEDADIREICQSLQMKIIPKNYSAYIPIEIIYDKPTFIFLDDSEVLTSAWKKYAELNGRKVIVFNDVNDFLFMVQFYPTDTLIYIDSDLGNDVKGQDVAKNLYDKGYRKIYLATGYDKDQFPEIPWVVGIVGKNFPIQ